MHDDPTIGELRDGLVDDRLPDAATRERLRRRLDARIAAVAGDVANVPSRPSRQAHRIPRVALGTAFAGAVAIVLIVALSPWQRTPGSHAPIPAPTAAQAALLQAADAAGSVDWAPLTGSEFHHVYATSFTPPIRPNPKALKLNGRNIEAGSWFGGPTGISSSETWVARSGAGRLVLVDGGNPNTDAGPKTFRDPRTGEIRQATAARPPYGESVNVDASLRNASGTSVFTRFGNGDPELQQGWEALGRGFRPTYHSAMTDDPRLGPAYVRSVHWQSWSLTMAEVDDLNEASADDASDRFERLLKGRVDEELELYGPVPNGVLGVTQESARREAQIQLAVRILGTAPLAPQVRAAIFEWLAGQPHARMDGAAKDVIGRAGTRVTFEWIHDKRVAAYETTTDELVEDARAGGESIESATPRRSWKVPTHRQYRRWLVSLVFDPKRGELLQTYEFSSFGVEGKGLVVPRLQRVHGADGIKARVDTSLNGHGYGISAGAQLYRARDRVTSIKPLSPICLTYAKVCRDSGRPLRSPY